MLNDGSMTPEEVMLAHQYLYYVVDLPVIQDREYDAFCDEHGLFGGGGSDRGQDYDWVVKDFALGLKWAEIGLEKQLTRKKSSDIT